MMFNFPSHVGGFTAALKGLPKVPNSTSPSVGEVVSMLRFSLPKDYVRSFKDSESLVDISTAVQAQNLQRRVYNAPFNESKDALIKKWTREWRKRVGETKEVNTIVDKYGALSLLMAIEHAGLLHILYEEEEDSEIWKQVDEGKWEGKQRAMDLKNVVNVGSSVEEGKKAKHTFNAQFRRAVEDAKKVDDGLLVDGLRYDLWFNIVGPALVARMGQVTVKRLQQSMEDMRAGGIGGGGGVGGGGRGALGDLWSDGGGDGEEDHEVVAVHELLKRAGVEEDETRAFARMSMQQMVPLKEVFTLGHGQLSPLVRKTGVWDGLTRRRVEEMKHGSAVIKREKETGNWEPWAREVKRIQGKGAMQAGPKYWTLLNPSGGGNGTKTDETWRRYVKVLGCLLAWLVEEIKLPTLVHLPRRIPSDNLNLATAWLQLIHR
ncbi:hypothetical protein TrRE_jg2043 [Triparma retinervis]|uniref:Uncharacterized protein n=1 Tax=Triparma retinervis TaxID=2557542 RepID=A0A9W7DRA1_9STRA|nr:hypothetical protein TrRE_jg2043 [Triparma retinervis]